MINRFAIKLAGSTKLSVQLRSRMSVILGVPFFRETYRVSRRRCLEDRKEAQKVDL